MLVQFVLWVSSPEYSLRSNEPGVSNIKFINLDVSGAKYKQLS